MRLRLLIALITSFTLTAPLFAACDWTTTPGNKAKQTCDAVIGTAAEPLSLLHLAGANGASVITFDNTGSQKLRVGGLAGVSNWGAMTLNLRWDGNYFNLDDASKNGWFLKLDGRGNNDAHLWNGLWLYRVPNGTPHAGDEAAVFGITNGYAFFRDKVGAGTLSPLAELHVQSVLDAYTMRGILNDQFYNDIGASSLHLRKARGIPGAPTAVLNGDYLATVNSWGYDGSQYHVRARVRFGVDGAVAAGNVPSYFQVMTGSTAEVERLRITSAGDVGIGTSTPAQKLDVTGNIHATGNIAADGTIFAKYQDVAEWVPAIGEVGPGTVVIIAQAADNVVTPSTEAYDTRVAGVVSAQPGIVLGEGSASKAMIATTGRVKVRVDASRAAIHRGDILVSSAKSGVAMKSEPVDFGGIKMHRPGTVIGKALEDLDSGTGEILVLLTLQ